MIPFSPAYRRDGADARPRLRFSGVRRLASTGNADRDAEPAGGEPDSPLGQLEALWVRISAPPTLQPLTLPRGGRDDRRKMGRGIVGFFGDHGRLGDHQAAQVVPRKASSRWSIPVSLIFSAAVRTPEGHCSCWRNLRFAACSKTLRSLLGGLAI